MPMLPVLMSVVATFLSGILILGAPADIYQKGKTQKRARKFFFNFTKILREISELASRYGLDKCQK